MKFFSTTKVFQFSWDQVSIAFWNRYPNPQSSHVISEDTISRKLVDGKLISHRILTKTSSLPKWSKKFMPAGSSKVCILEESIVDPKTKTLTTYTHNVGLTKYMVLDEKCVYRPSPDNKGWTSCERQAWVSSSVFGVSSAIQSFGLERFKKNIPKTVKGVEYVLNRMFSPPGTMATEVAGQGKSSRLQIHSEKLKESALKAKESAKELAKSKTTSVVEKSKAKAQSVPV